MGDTDVPRASRFSKFEASIYLDVSLTLLQEPVQAQLRYL